MAGSVAAKAWSVLRNKWYGLQLDDADNLKTNPGASDASLDTIDVSRMSKGDVVTTHSGLTGASLSNALDCIGRNAILVDVNVSAFTSGTVTLTVMGAVDSSGTYGTCWESSGGAKQAMSFNITAATRIVQVFRGVPDSVKINITGTFVATYTVKAQPLNF